MTRMHTSPLSPIEWEWSITENGDSCFILTHGNKQTSIFNFKNSSYIDVLGRFVNFIEKEYYLYHID